MNRQSSIGAFLVVAFRVALLAALFGAGWSIYRRLPGESFPAFGGTEEASETSLHIVLRRAPNAARLQSEVPVEVYSIDVAAARREFLSEPQRGVRLEEFINRRMGNHQPIRGKLDRDGRAVIAVPPGRWWIHATLEGEPEVTWRLPVYVSGREKVVELTHENAYMRAKKF